MEINKFPQYLFCGLGSTWWRAPADGQALTGAGSTSIASPCQGCLTAPPDLPATGQLS